MKKIILIAVLLCSMDLNALGFESNQICRKESMYVGIYDQYGRYEVVQTDSLCSQRKTQYDCGLEHCASNRSMCDLFIKTKFVSLVFKDVEFLKGKLNFIRDEIHEIKNCTYMLSIKDVCVNGQECIERSVFRMRNGNIKLFKPAVCKCRGKFNYHCQEHSLCTIHKKACDLFFSFYNQTKPVTPKPCEKKIIKIK